VRALVVLGSLFLATGLFAETRGLAIADFDGPNPLSGWVFSRDSGSGTAFGSLAIGQGHAGHGAVLEYRFDCRAGSSCGAVAALWKPAKPLKFKHRAAVAMWISAAPELKVTLLVTDRREGQKRYPFEVVTLENAAGGWQRVSIPLAARSTGYGDEMHTGAPEGRITAIGILAEPRFPRVMHGSLGFDDVWLLDSPDQAFELRPDARLVPPPRGSSQLAPRLGVNIHNLGDTAALDLARKAGFRFVRADLLWRLVERQGAYRFFVYDRLFAALAARGMGALWILDYGHPQHGGDHPRTPDDVAAFARYAEAVAAHFQGRNVRYEVWNEPDTERFWPPSPNSAEYSVLLREAVTAIRRADPQAPVASGGLSGIDLSFLEAILSAGAAAQVSAVAMHPYRRASPETLAAQLPLLREAVKQTLDGAVEVWDTEWGYASYDYFSKNLSGDGHSAAGRKRQAVLACREVLTVWALGLPVAVWYDLRDDGQDGRNPEHNYGLLDAGNAAKPAMAAIAGLASFAGNHIFAGMLADPPDGLHVMRLDGAADRLFAIWSDQPDASITMRFATPDFLAATNLLGEPLKIRDQGRDNVEIPVLESDGPVYLTFRSGK
jgi:polysaccharide biosynthesis protein PslG